MSPSEGRPSDGTPTDAPVTEHPARELEDLLVELLAVPSVTGEEEALADWVAEHFESADERVRRVGNSLVVGELDPDRSNVLLVGHLDVVPPTAADRIPRREGDRIIGRGASDMKSGLAVAMDCFADPALRAGPLNTLVVAYAGEEGPHEDNELAPLLEAIPELTDAALAIVLEPTDRSVQLGCLGTMHAEVTFHGQAAHSARPWYGENALTGAGSFLTELDDRPVEDVVCDGLVFREVVTATQAWTSSASGTTNARNVVPERFTVNVNLRFSPERTVEDAEQLLHGIVGDRARVLVTDRAPAARPHRDSPLVSRFVESAEAPVAAKQAWTDVARLSAVGVPALNYGPGPAAQAHRAGEYIDVADLHAARAALARFLRPDPGGG